MYHSLNLESNLRVVPQQASVVVGHIVTTLRLVYADLALRRHIVEVLVGVHTSLLWRCPSCRVYTSCPLTCVILLHPIREESDGVLGRRIAAQVRRDAPGSAGHDAYWLPLGDHALVDVDVVRVQVVRDVTVLARPGLESLQLALRLAHVAVEVVEIAQLLRTEPSVRIGRVISLVVLDVYENTVLLRRLEEFLVMLHRFYRWLGYEDMYAALNSVKSDRVVRSIGGKDCYCPMVSI